MEAESDNRLQGGGEEGSPPANTVEMVAPGEHDQALRDDQARQLLLGERLPAQRLQTVEQDDPLRRQGAADERGHPTARGVAPQVGEVGAGAGQQPLIPPHGPHLRGHCGEEGRGHAWLPRGEIDRRGLGAVQAPPYGRQRLLRGALARRRHRR